VNRLRVQLKYWAFRLEHLFKTGEWITITVTV
jgi:hypothetical protein